MSSTQSKTNTLPDASPSSESVPAAGVDATPNQQRGSDVLVVHGVTADGAGLNVIRQRNRRLEFGAVHPARPGRPIHGELVKLRPRPECPLVCDVDVQYSPPDPEPQPSDVARPTANERRGPAHVATDAYRTNWDAIWARPPKGDLVN